MEKFDDKFYENLLDYLEIKFPGLHSNEVYDMFTGEPAGYYHWWIEDKELAGVGFSNWKEVVEDIFRNLNLPENY